MTNIFSKYSFGIPIPLSLTENLYLSSIFSAPISILTGSSIITNSLLRFHLSFVPVVDIRGMRVFMVKWFMEMGMRMIPGKIAIMVMHMVFFGVMVEVLMLDRDMMVPMHMLLGRENQGPYKHQTECDYQLQVRILPEYEK